MLLESSLVSLERKKTSHCHLVFPGPLSLTCFLPRDSCRFPSSSSVDFNLWQSSYLGPRPLFNLPSIVLLLQQSDILRYFSVIIDIKQHSFPVLSLLLNFSGLAGSPPSSFPGSEGERERWGPWMRYRNVRGSAVLAWPSHCAPQFSVNVVRLSKTLQMSFSFWWFCPLFPTILATNCEPSCFSSFVHHIKSEGMCDHRPVPNLGGKKDF